MQEVRIPERPPHILPLPEGMTRPRWSVMIPVYNCYRFLEEALNSVLLQGYAAADMQIEVIDDGSSDGDYAALVSRLGQGRVDYFRQPQNRGSLRNFETCINRSRGIYVHILHGDDLVKPGYYQAMDHLFDKYPGIGAAFCRYVYVGESGKPLYYRNEEMSMPGVLDDWLLRLAQRQRLQFCTVAVKRHVYEQLGGFYGVNYGEDWEMWMRIAQRYPVAYDPAVLAAYRLHKNSISGSSYASAKNLQDLQWVIGTIRQYLPVERQDELYREAMRFYAHYGIKIANDLWYGLHDKQGARVQVREALSMHADPLMIWKITKLYAKMALNITSFIPRKKQSDI
ncbi:glycosyltransferase family 2 protein [Paraflavitalea pollutisoli]|uniref:glycosyltransferase family 2 protein n=1 Tax=Paraflavitalea pollutisoli TaxID=3034143 RepID=UPI0023EDBCFE|nr:glycosyltransferase [Paraflavitalea sp. H1-2-19X]